MSDPAPPPADHTGLWADPAQTNVLAAAADADSGSYEFAPADAAQTPPPATVGDYRIAAKLGEGGMGAVYRAVRARDGREVALKVLSRKVVQRAGFIQRFHREVRTMGRLTHPNIVRYLAAGEANGQVYLAMELVDGGSLADRVSRAGRLSVADALAVGVAAGRALEHAHQNHIIHRDVKPDNLLLTAAGEVKLADLGLAKDTDDTDGALTGTGTGMGTPLYAPPEQIRDAKRADARSDLYALGGVMYFALTGDPPFGAGSNFLELVTAKEKGVYPLASAKNPLVPPAVDRILSKLLAKPPEFRYQWAAEFLQDAEWAGFTADRLSPAGG